MSKFFIEANQMQENKITLLGEDVNHIANVLRKKVGDEINICNISTSENFLCQIEEINKDFITCKKQKALQTNTESNTEVTIFQGLPKAEKMELIIQKCTELGAKYFVPVQMERCVVKLDNKSQTKKIERWNKIAETAAKQSGRNFIPKVENLINLQNLLNLIQKYDIVLLAYENENKTTLKQVLRNLPNNKNLKIGIIIGPEGGLTKEEVETLEKAGAKTITLGKRILRTETAGFAMTAAIMYELE